MSDQIKSSEQGEASAAYLPPMEVKEKALLLVENYAFRADEALDKVRQSIDQLHQVLKEAQAQLSQREREFAVLNGQKDLLLDLQKKIVSQDTKI